MDRPTTLNHSDAGAGSPPPPNSNGKPASSTASGSPGAGAKPLKGIAPIPVGKVIPVPRQPKPVRKHTAIPLNTAITAAKKSGRMILDVRALKDEALLGRFIEQTNARDLGRFRVAVAAQRSDDIDRILCELDAQAATAGGLSAIPTRLAIQKVRIEAIDASVRVGMALLETEAIPEPSAIRPPTLPGFGSSPIQINVNGAASVSTPPTKNP